jgi:hypothetical protein
MMVTNLKVIHVGRNFTIQPLRKADGIVSIGLGELNLGRRLKLARGTEQCISSLKEKYQGRSVTVYYFQYFK